MKIKVTISLCGVEFENLPRFFFFSLFCIYADFETINKKVGITKLMDEDENSNPILSGLLHSDILYDAVNDTWIMKSLKVRM